MPARWENPAVPPTMPEPILRTARLTIVPLTTLHEAEHAQASGDPADATRDTRAAEAHWLEHGFGPWAVRDCQDGSFLGGAELHLAGAGIQGIAPDEIEAGWWVRRDRRQEGIALEAMRAAIDDLWTRTGARSITAYIAGENEASTRLAASLGFRVRGPGRGRSGEAMTVYELDRPTTPTLEAGGATSTAAT
jgi:RimJ/RimL family protein N-acetyltransferase